MNPLRSGQKGQQRHDDGSRTRELLTHGFDSRNQFPQLLLASIFQQFIASSIGGSSVCQVLKLAQDEQRKEPFRLLVILVDRKTGAHRTYTI